jgi:hypothetical protein
MARLRWNHMRTKVAVLICVCLLMSTSVPTVVANDDVDCEELIQKILEGIALSEPVDEHVDEFVKHCPEGIPDPTCLFTDVDGNCWPGNSDPNVDPKNPFDVGANNDGAYSGTGYAECSVLGLTCAAAVALADDFCFTASATIEVFPGEGSIEVCGAFGIALGVGSAIVLVDAEVLSSAVVEGFQHHPEETAKECACVPSTHGCYPWHTCSEYVAEEAWTEKVHHDYDMCFEQKSSLDDPYDLGKGFTCPARATGMPQGSTVDCYDASSNANSQSGSWSSRARCRSTRL